MTPDNLIDRSPGSNFEVPTLVPTKAWDEPYRGRLSVTINGEVRVPNYAEAVQIPEAVFKQAENIGEELMALSDQVPQLIQLPELRSRAGLSQSTYESVYAPFLQAPHNMFFIGADAILDKSGRIKLIEINARPQVLGRYDLATPMFLDPGDGNARITPSLKSILETRIDDGSIGVVVSHPKNAFHNHHELFAEQSGYELVTLQDLHTNDIGDVVYDGQRVGMIFRQFANRNLFQPEITDPLVLEAVMQGRVNVVNSPLSDFMKEKTLFPHLAQLCPGIRNYLPEMVVVNTGQDIDLRGYRGWWLKGETRGSRELVLELGKQNLQGWPGQVVRDIVSGNIEDAENVLRGREGRTADRLREHVRDIKGSVPEKWVLQENIEPRGFFIKGEDGQDAKLYSTLRLYFVKSDTGKPHTFLEFLAGKNARVSAAGFTIPVRRGLPQTIAV